MGIINPKDIASYLHHHVLGESSAKEDYVSRVMPRRGMLTLTLTLTPTLTLTLTLIATPALALPLTLALTPAL